MPAPSSAPVFFGVSDSTLAVSSTGAPVANGEIVIGADFRASAWSASQLIYEGVELSTVASAGTPLPGMWRAQQKLDAPNSAGWVFGGYFIRVS